MPSIADSINKLYTLAEQEFGQLVSADKTLFDAVAHHEEANFKADTEDLNNPEAAEQWGSERTLNADRLVWLVTTPEVAELFSFRGLRISGAKIWGELNLEYATVSVPLIFDTCAFPNPLILQNSKLRTLQLKGTHVSEIKADEMHVEGSVSLCDGFVARGGVSLVGAKIEGDLNCTGGQFINPKKTALSASAAMITADVFLCDGFEAEGEVNLVRASIGGLLTCDRGKFRNAGQTALSASGATIAADVFLRNGFEAEGMVNLRIASIGGNLRCRGGHFLNKNGNAIDAESITIGGSVFLGGQRHATSFQAEGNVNFLSATIDGRLELEGMESSNLESMILDLRFAKVNTFSFKDEPAETIWLAETIWIEKMKQGQLYLNGFVYSSVNVAKNAIKSQRLLKWLRLQSKDDFALQPYEQLAAILKENGHQEAATAILIGKEEDRRRYGGLGCWGKSWNWFLGLTIAHGYRPQNALIYSVFVMLVGWGFFSVGEGLMTETNDKHKSYAVFNSLVYSIDAFTPVVDFHQEGTWLPDASKGKEIPLVLFKVRQGELLRTYFWFQIVAGWVLTSLWVAGFTGLVRSQK